MPNEIRTVIARRKRKPVVEALHEHLKKPFTSGDEMRIIYPRTSSSRNFLITIEEGNIIPFVDALPHN